MVGRGAHEHDRGHYHHPTPSSCSVELAARYKAKIHHHCHLFPGYIVSFSLGSPCEGTSLISYSIIVITAIRIKVIMDFDPQDASGHLGPITFWSILEPLLGLINCCLPVIQPAISKVSGHRVWSAPNSRPDKDRGYNWGPKLSRDGPNNGRFSKIDTLYPLTTVQVMSQDDVYANHIGSSTHAVAVDQGDLEKGPSATDQAPEFIVVEQRWEVSSGSI